MESLTMNNSVMISAAVALTVTALFMWQGYTKGALSTARGLLCSLSGYLAAYRYAMPLTGYVRSMTALEWLPALVLSSVVLFLLASVVAGIVLAKMREVLVTLREGDEEHDPHLGLVTGAVAGVVLAVLLVWLTGISLDAIRVRDNAAALAKPSVDPVRAVAGQVVGSVVQFAVEQKVGTDSVAPELVGELIANPVAVGQQLTQLSHSESTRQLFTNPAMQELMSHDNIDQLRQQPAFRQLMQDSMTGQLLSGLSQGTNAPVSATKERAVASFLVSLWHKSERIKADPRYEAILRKPEIKALLVNPTPLGLLGNQDIHTLAEIAFTETPKTAPALLTAAVPAVASIPTPAASVAAMPDADSAVTAAAETQVIYRWTDKDGQQHFSSTKPEGNIAVEAVQPR